MGPNCFSIAKQAIVLHTFGSPEKDSVLDFVYLENSSVLLMRDLYWATTVWRV